MLFPVLLATLMIQESRFQELVQTEPILEEEAATAEYIMAKVFKKIEENKSLRDASIRYQKRLITEDLGDEKGRPKIIKDQIFSMFSRNGKTIQLLIAEDGKTLKVPKEKSPRINLDTALQSRYRYTLSNEPLQRDRITGRLCYYLTFIPVDEPPEAKNHEDAVLNHLKGSLVIDAELWYIVRLQGELTQAFKINPVVPMVKFDVSIEQQHIQIPSGQVIVIPMQTVVVLHYWRPSVKIVSEVHQRETAIFGQIEFI